jgi:hypothetical protein
LKYRYIISYHTNTWGCGIARFNELLSGELDSEVLSFKEMCVRKPFEKILISISLKEFSEKDRLELEDLFQNPQNELNFDLLLHSLDESNLEKMIISKSNRIFSLNEEITSKLQKLGTVSATLFTPSLFTSKISKEDNQKNTLKLITFGMAHKIELDLIYKLIENVKESGMHPKIYLSTAIHVGEQPLDNLTQTIQEIEQKLKIEINFLGFLSDSALAKSIQEADVLFRFFNPAVRANSTSIMAGMSLGVPTFTNTDEFSPKWLRHNYNYFDISKLNGSLTKELLTSVGKQGKIDYESNASWKHLKKSFDN